VKVAHTVGGGDTAPDRHPRSWPGGRPGRRASAAPGSIAAVPARTRPSRQTPRPRRHSIAAKLTFRAPAAGATKRSRRRPFAEREARARWVKRPHGRRASRPRVAVGAPQAGHAAVEERRAVYVPVRPREPRPLLAGEEAAAVCVREEDVAYSGRKRGGACRDRRRAAPFRSAAAPPARVARVRGRARGRHRAAPGRTAAPCRGSTGAAPGARRGARSRRGSRRQTVEGGAAARASRG